MSFATLIEKLDEIAGENGVGRIDHIENRLVGIKSREIYEAPAATVLIKAHKELEDIVLERDLAHFKPLIDKQICEVIYNGLWFSPLMAALKAFVAQSQKVVNGTIKLELFKGNIIILGRKANDSLYDKDLATYTSSDSFDQEAAKGFIKLWCLPTEVANQVAMKNKGGEA
ncbi:hypothetical protein GCM10020006_12740 [Fructilactobacillus sanfranciscensis]|nr:argininosuccinate synthase [Fructilactobacillus sanfranciscensis DSM 20451]